MYLHVLHCYIDPKLPWPRWTSKDGHTVQLKVGSSVLKTEPTALLTRDDVNICIACAKNKAYAIEILIKPECAG